MSVLLGLALGLSACAADWEPVFDKTVDAQFFDTVAIAPPEDALTFARAGGDKTRRLIAVTAYENGNVKGVDLSGALGRSLDDPIDLFVESGYDVILEAVNEASPAFQTSVAVTDLVAPVDLASHHVAAGTNFPEHAGEASVEGGPFMFPKIVVPTGPHSPISAGDGLLDYEVELAWVTMEPVTKGRSPQHLGLIACNDYTDRAKLLANVNLDDIESGEGFTTGKSFPGSLPVGDLFVVPRDYRAFAAGLQLRLYVNNRLRQRSSAAEAIWNVDELFVQAWARREMTYNHLGEDVLLFASSDGIPARTLMMSGTPHGTVFRSVSLNHIVSGISSWLSGGWDRPAFDHVIDAYIDDAHDAGAYLQPGDEVVIHIEHLGVIRNEVAR